MTSGVIVPDEVKGLLQKMKVNKKGDDPCERLRLVILHIEGDYIKVEKEFVERDLEEKGNVYKLLQSEMREHDCRYMLYDCHFDIKDCGKEELVFIMWSCDDAPVGLRMRYASSKNDLKKIAGAKHEFEFHGQDEITLKAFAESLERVAKTGVICLEGLDVCGC